MMSRQKRILCVLVCSAIPSGALVSLPANAAIAHFLEFYVATGANADVGSQFWGVHDIVDNGDGTFDSDGSKSESQLWSYQWDITAHPDPFVDAVFTLSNMSNATQTFTVVTDLAVGNTFPTPTFGGKISGSVVDTNGNGTATLGGVGSSSIYMGLIDDNQVLPLLSGQFSCNSANCTQNIGLIQSGLQPDLLTPDGSLSYAGIVMEKISIRLNFTLTAGDTATFQAYFNVLPIPVPAAVWLLGSGLLGLVAVARRREQFA